MARFFEALVVVGAGLAVSGCGGKSSRDALQGVPNGAAGADTGGSAGAGGNILLFDAGPAAGSAGTTSTLPPPGTLAQWNCSSLLLHCGTPAGNGHDAYALEQACPQELTRPQSPADCTPDETLQCAAATWLPTGETIIVTCSCQPRSMTCACQNDSYGEAVCAPDRVTCYCAYPVIAK